MNVHLLPYANPRSKKNYIKTILNHAQNCKTTEIKKYYPDLPEVYNKNSYPIWGVTNGGRDCNKKPWSKMKANDVAVFYKDRKFDNYCLILDKFNSNETANAILKKYQDDISKAGDKLKNETPITEGGSKTRKNIRKNPHKNRTRKSKK